MADRTYNYVVALDDQGSAVFEGFKNTVKDGSSEISKSFEQINNSAKDYSNTTSNLTTLIRSQRSEHREQAFVMTQLRDVIGGVSLGLAMMGAIGGDSAKQLTSSLQEGFLTFQGVSFLLADLGPEVAIPTAAVAGLGTAFLTAMKGASDETKKAELELDGLELKLGRISQLQYGNDLKKQLQDAEAEVVRLEKLAETPLNKANWSDFVEKIEDYFKGGVSTAITEAKVKADQLEESFKNISERISEDDNQKGTTDQIAALQRLYDEQQMVYGSMELLKAKEEDAQKALNGLTSEDEGYTEAQANLAKATTDVKDAQSLQQITQDLLTGKIKEGNMSLQTGTTELGRMKMSLSEIDKDPTLNDMAIRSKAIEKGFTDQLTSAKSMYAGIDALRKNDLAGLEGELKKAQKDYEEQAKMVDQVFSQPVSKSLRDALVTEFDNDLGQQNSILQKMLGQMGEALIEWGAEQLEKVLTNAVMAQSSSAATIAALSADMEALEAAAAPAALAVNVASFGAAGAAAAASFAAAAAAEGAGSSLGFIGKSPLSFHYGGRVPKAHDGMFVSASPMDEFPIIVRGGETIRTESQEAQLQNNINQSTNSTDNSNSTVINNYFSINGPIADSDAFKKIVQDGMRKLGITDPTKYFQNNRGQVTLS